VEEDSSRFIAGALLGIWDPGHIGGPRVHASGGVALLDPSDPSRLRTFLQALLDRSSDLRASSLEVTIRIPSSIGDTVNPAAPEFESVLRSLHFEVSKTLGTYYVDISRASEEALLESFGKNPRRHIRKALREGLVVERSSDPAEFESFYESHRTMCRRKGIDPFPRGFTKEALLPLARAGHGDLFVARFRGVVRNYLFTGNIGKPIYLWGALDEAAREDGCPQTGQALHFGAMCHFRACGKTVYDFGGSPGPVPEASHPNFSVWKFKYEFGVSYVRFLGSWTLVLRPAHAKMLQLVDRAFALGSRITGR